MPAVYPGDSAAATTLGQPQLDQLLAPIALYPDQLLTDILAASTYPAEIVEARRWLADPAHAGLQGDAVTDAANTQNWDPSVKALLIFPQVLAMMDSRLDWTEQLGRTFMAQQADVMNAVQRLRHQAQFAGTLQNGPQDQVVNDGDSIAINPPSNQQIYLPAYNAACVYGPAEGCDAEADAVDWGAGVFVPYGYWQWGLVDWGRREIRLDYDFSRGGGHWRGEGQAGVAGDAVWRHAGPRGFAPAHLGGNVGGHDSFQYAPPATEFSHPNVPHAVNRGFGGGAPFRPAGGFAQSAPHPVTVHAAPPAVAAPAVAAHGGGFGRR
jgi:hypothetical protein